MFDFGKGLEWLIAIAKKAEESHTNTYMESKRITVNDKFSCELRVKSPYRDKPSRVEGK